MTEAIEAVQREKHSCPSNIDEEDSASSSFQQTILEEVFTSDYNITEKEVLEYCDVVGIDPCEESHLLPLARTALYQPVPGPWTPVEDSKAGVYFYNPATGESSWNHPVDAIVRALVTRDRNRNKTCGDSCFEDLNSEDDLISDLLRGETSICDLTRSECDSNHPSEYVTTALTLAEQCFKTSSKSNDKSSVPLIVSYSNGSHKKNKVLRVVNSGNGETGFTSNRQVTNESDCVITNRSESSDISIASYVRANDNDSSGVTNKSPLEPWEKPEPDEDYQSSGRLTPPDGAECDEVPGMLGSRDGPGRGLGRPGLGPSPLGTPPSLGGLAPLGGHPPLGASAPLGGPFPLGRAPMGSSPLGGSRIPPLGGHLTPLVPIASANKREQGLQLSPLKSKPMGGVQQQTSHKRDGNANPPLQRQTHLGERRTDSSSRNLSMKQNVPQNTGRQQGDGQSASASAAAAASVANSPPRSILKGPVIAGRQGPQRNQGVDRLALTQTKESRNIHFDFETDGMEFHSSEEDFEEELDEEELEEEEEYEDEEEDYDSETEDPEEEAMLRERGIIDDESELGGLVLNDASDLMLSGAGQEGNKSKPLGTSPLKPEDAKAKPKDIPINSTKKQIQGTLGQQQKADQAPLRPKSAVNQQATNKQQVNQVPQSMKNTAEAIKKGNTAEAIKRGAEVKAPEERKLELEGTPKNRKVNPLDRVVAKLGGKSEKSNQVKADVPPAAPAATKNLNVNLTGLMKQNLSEDEESLENEKPAPMDYPTPNLQTEKIKEIEKLRKEEEKRIRDELEQSMKLLKEQLNKEYEDQRNKLREEHDKAIQKLQSQEKEKYEATRKQIVSKIEEENKKEMEKVKNSLEKELSQKKNNIIKDLEAKYNKETENMKLAFVKEMEQKKNTLQKEHEEEMEDLQAELKSLYDKEKQDKQSELQSARTAAITRNKAAADMAIADLERSMGEVLRERQAQIRREHSKQLSILSEELEKELESVAWQAKERETTEKQSHASKLASLKEEHESSLKEMQEIHKEELELIEMQHRENSEKLKAEFKEELTKQKVELEYKLTELKIEYEQQLISFENEHLEQIGNMEERQVDGGNTGSDYNGEEEESHEDKEAVKAGSDRLHQEDHKYDQMLSELRERRKTLEHDLEDLKSKENKVRDLKSKTVVPGSLCCSGPVCTHELKYNKMKAKYANLVSRIKSEKAKKSIQKMSTVHDILASEKTTSESNTNEFDGGVHSEDASSSVMSSPKHLRPFITSVKSAETSSGDEDIKLATKVLEKYGRVSDLGNTRNMSRSGNIDFKSHSKKTLTNMPRKAWMDDDLLVHGRRELIKAEKFLKSSQVKFPGRLGDLEAEDIQREILRQDAGFEVQNNEGRSRRLSLGPGGSLPSDTEESDEITHDAPSSSSDFGLDQILAKISATSKISPADIHRGKSVGVKNRPIRSASSLERGLNKLSEPFQTQSKGYNTLSASAPLRIEDLKVGSVPDLGPETVDRIANINQYLQRRWTNYFGEMTVPLGGRVGWPTQVIGQPSLLVGKSNSPGFMNNKISTSDGKVNTTVLIGTTLKSGQPDDVDLNQKIEDLRSWLNNAQSINATPKEV